MADLLMIVDTALAEVPVNLMPLLDDTDFKTRETAVAFNAAGMDLVWNFVTTGGAYTQTAVTPTSAGNYDWANQGDGMYSIEIPASGGASINNDTEGFGWFSGLATGVLPWRGPVIQFSPANVVNSLIEGSDKLQVHADEITAGLITAAAIAADAITAAKVAADVGGEIADAVWDEATSALTTVGSIGKLLVDNVTASISAVKAKTDNLPSDPADASDIAALIDALPTATENAAALLDLSNGIETLITPRQAIRLILAASAGKLSGAATTTVTIRNVGDSKDRIVATVDSSGNRSAVTVDGT